MCEPCALLNFEKRTQTHDLTGKVALVTGARVKIGLEIALILLRNGARVIAQTRFPKSAAEAYSKVHDFELWKDRLDIYGVDFKQIPSVYEFCALIKQKYSRLDILINNACQTIRKPAALYDNLVQFELKADLVEDKKALLKLEN